MERRVDWLCECVALMKLKNVTIFHGRSDEVIDKIKSHEIPAFDVVTCRAVAPMTKLAGWTIPLLNKHGKLIALKGKSAQAEDGIRDSVASRGLGDVYKRQLLLLSLWIGTTAVSYTHLTLPTIYSV